MVTLELRDAGAGVLARSHRPTDCIAFLRSRIRRTRKEIADLRGVATLSELCGDDLAP